MPEQKKEKRTRKPASEPKSTTKRTRNRQSQNAAGGDPDLQWPWGPTRQQPGSKKKTDSDSSGKDPLWREDSPNWQWVDGVLRQLQEMLGEFLSTQKGSSIKDVLKDPAQQLKDALNTVLGDVKEAMGTVEEALEKAHKGSADKDARHTRTRYSAYLHEGFTPEEAFQLVVAEKLAGNTMTSPLTHPVLSRVLKDLGTKRTKKT